MHELEEFFGQRLHEEGLTTTSGWMTHRLGGFPKQGDVFNFGPYELRVKETDGLRVTRLVLTRMR